MKYLALSFSVFFLSTAHAETFQSTTKQATLLELYTSQGCSSCPPAEKWINKLKTDKTLWKEVVPIAFHVDYWDYLGWKDKYASKTNSKRQTEYYKQRKTTAIYTPGFVANGKQWSNWRFLSLPKNKQKVGILKADVNGNTVTAKYSDFFPSYVLNVAVLGFDIDTPIHAGENEGETLPQDFVVLHHQTVSAKNKQWQATLPRYQQKGVQRYGLAVWLQNGKDLAPIQATGGWLKP